MMERDIVSRLERWTGQSVGSEQRAAKAMQGVIAPAVYGGKPRRILCYLDRQKLEVRGLSLMDVQETLLKQNVLIPAGNAKRGDLDFQIFTNALTDTVDEINLTPIRVDDGAPVLLRDVGQATDAGQIQSNAVRSQRSATPHKVRLGDAPDRDMVKLSYERKLFTDTIKLDA